MSFTDAVFTAEDTDSRQVAFRTGKIIEAPIPHAAHAEATPMQANSLKAWLIFCLASGCLNFNSRSELIAQVPPSRPRDTPEPLDQSKQVFASIATSPPQTADSERAAVPATVGSVLVLNYSKCDLHDRPVSAELTREAANRPNLRLVEITDGKSLPIASQVERCDPPRLWWLLNIRDDAASKRTFRVEEGETFDGPAVKVDQTADFLEVVRGQAKVLRYNSKHVEAPSGLNRKYGRSAYVHPVWTPTGAIVTEQFPTDHGHQSGIFLAYVKTEFEGRTPDFWNLAGGTGRVRFKKTQELTSGQVFGEIKVEHEHVDLSVPDPKVVLNEIWNIRVWNCSGPQVPFWTIDLTSEIRCATKSPLKLPEYHYGGMALRGAESWGGQNAQFITSEGKNRKSGNHSRPHWCDLSGPLGNDRGGIAIMTHPLNFRFPEPLRIHSTMPYLVYTPSFSGDWEISPEKVHVSRYRFVIHDGALESSLLEHVWKDFSQPLTAHNGIP